MTTNLEIAGAGRGLPSVDGPAPALPCIDCGGLERDHISAGHRYYPQGTCISCMRPGLVRDHWTGHIVCTSCYIEKNGIVG
jgi:hypothetical protein